jgi:hypothetical protein
MDLGWIVTLVSPDASTAQISWVRANDAPTQSGGLTLTTEVGDVAGVRAIAASRGLAIVYPLTDETWGVRRFHVEDPNGVLVNVVTHIKQGGPTGRSSELPNWLAVVQTPWELRLHDIERAWRRKLAACRPHM